jgi:hypothetical protein
MRLATGLALILGMLAGVAGDDFLRQAPRAKAETSRQVMMCMKGDRR